MFKPMSFKVTRWTDSGIYDGKHFKSPCIEIEYKKYFLFMVFEPWYLWLSNIQEALAKGNYYSLGFVNITFGVHK